MLKIIIYCKRYDNYHKRKKKKRKDWRRVGESEWGWGVECWFLVDQLQGGFAGETVPNWFMTFDFCHNRDDDGSHAAC